MFDVPMTWSCFGDWMRKGISSSLPLHQEYDAHSLCSINVPLVMMCLWIYEVVDFTTEYIWEAILWRNSYILRIVHLRSNTFETLLRRNKTVFKCKKYPNKNRFQSNLAIVCFIISFSLASQNEVKFSLTLLDNKQ